MLRTELCALRGEVVDDIRLPISFVYLGHIGEDAAYPSFDGAGTPLASLYLRVDSDTQGIQTCFFDEARLFGLLLLVLWGLLLPLGSGLFWDNCCV